MYRSTKARGQIQYITLLHGHTCIIYMHNKLDHAILNVMGNYHISLHLPSYNKKNAFM